MTEGGVAFLSRPHCLSLCLSFPLVFEFLFPSPFRRRDSPTSPSCTPLSVRRRSALSARRERRNSARALSIL